MLIVVLYTHWRVEPGLVWFLVGTGCIIYIGTGAIGFLN